MKKLLPLALVAGTLMAAACGHSPNDTRPGENPGNAFLPPDETIVTHPDATPTATPAGPVYLDAFFPNGTNQVHLGKCLGFTVVGNGVTFGADASVTVGSLGPVPFTRLDATHLRVGSPKTAGTCVYTPIFGDAGMQDVTVSSGPNTWTVAEGIELDPPQVYSFGMVGPSTRFGRDVVTDAGANTFETPYDVDIYTIATTEITRVYPHMDFFDLSTAGNVVPQLEFWNSKFPNDFLGRGALTTIFPQNSTAAFPDYFVVRDIKGQGGLGADYDVGVSADQLGWTADGSGCSGARPINPGAYHIDDALLTDAFNPANSFGCRDSIFGTPINAPGPDAAFTVTIPAGKSFRAAAYDNHWSQAIYLLPKSYSCNPQPEDCLAAAGFFGGGNTNQLRFTNESAVDEDFLLVFDTTAVSGTSDGAFLVNVEILDRK